MQQVQIVVFIKVDISLHTFCEHVILKAEISLSRYQYLKDVELAYKISSDRNYFKERIERNRAELNRCNIFFFRSSGNVCQRLVDPRSPSAAIRPWET